MRKYEFDAAKTKDEIVEWIRNYFRKNGPDCNAVIGISGGKDSMLMAKLFQELKRHNKFPFGVRQGFQYRGCFVL